MSYGRDSVKGGQLEFQGPLSDGDPKKFKYNMNCLGWEPSKICLDMA